jgi:glycerophosphoryl diester phosphodiesterase
MKKSIKRFLIIATFIIIFFFVCNVIPPKKVVEHNPFLTDNLPMVAAHRGGGVSNPENTLKAFKWCVNTAKVEILEFDLYLTKDGYLVYNHDSYIDETCDVNGDKTLEEVKNIIDEDSSKKHYIKDYTLNELRQFNFGYYFEKDGKMPYHHLNLLLLILYIFHL